MSGYGTTNFSSLKFYLSSNSFTVGGIFLCFIIISYYFYIIVNRNVISQVKPEQTLKACHQHRVLPSKEVFQVSQLSNSWHISIKIIIHFHNTKHNYVFENCYVFKRLILVCIKQGLFKSVNGCKY